METQIGAQMKRIVADRGYRGHNAPETHNSAVMKSLFDQSASGAATMAIKAISPSISATMTMAIATLV